MQMVVQSKRGLAFRLNRLNFKHIWSGFHNSQSRLNGHRR